MDHVLKDRLIGRSGRCPAGDAGVGKDYVKFPEIFGEGCEEPLAAFRNGEVSTVAACVGSELSDRLIQGLLVATGDGNQGAFRDEETGRRLSLAN